MFLIQMKIDRYWRTIGGRFSTQKSAYDKISQYMMATTTRTQSREYRVKRA